jgi:hypothetical protein
MAGRRQTWHIPAGAIAMRNPAKDGPEAVSRIVMNAHLRREQRGSVERLNGLTSNQRAPTRTESHPPPINPNFELHQKLLFGLSSLQSNPAFRLAAGGSEKQTELMCR